MLMSYQIIVFSLSWVIGFGLWFPTPLLVPGPKGDPAKPTETTITALVEASAKFSGKRVHVFASFHTDGIHESALMEPNCGLLDGTSKTPPPSQPQCARGIVPTNSTKAGDDPGKQSLDRELAQGNRSTRDKHITAEFTGIFRCIPSCASPKYFSLEIERVANLKVEMKDLKPHRPTH